MSFEPHYPKRVSQSKVRKGQASLNAYGELRIDSSDLATVGIDHSCVIDICRTTNRIALRRPRLGEESRAYKIHKRHGETSHVRSIFVRGPLRMFRIKPSDMAGEYGVIIPERAERLEISFNPGDWET